MSKTYLDNYLIVSHFSYGLKSNKSFLSLDKSILNFSTFYFFSTWEEYLSNPPIKRAWELISKNLPSLNSFFKKYYDNQTSLDISIEVKEIDKHCLYWPQGVNKEDLIKLYQKHFKIWEGQKDYFILSEEIEKHFQNKPSIFDSTPIS